MNSLGEWWPVTLTERLTEETYSATVHDAEETCWTGVHCANIRIATDAPPDAEVEYAVEKTPGEGLGVMLLGMQVQNVSPGSPAASAGLGSAQGRLLTHVNGEPVSSLAEVGALAHDQSSVSLRFGPVQPPPESPLGASVWGGGAGAPDAQLLASAASAALPPPTVGPSESSGDTPATDLLDGAATTFARPPSAAAAPASCGAAAGASPPAAQQRHTHDPRSGLPLVSPPQHLRAAFASFCSDGGRGPLRVVAHCFHELRKVSRKGRLDLRVCVATDRALLLCGADGRVFRRLAVCDLLEVVAGDVAPGGQCRLGLRARRAQGSLCRDWLLQCDAAQRDDIVAVLEAVASRLGLRLRVARAPSGVLTPAAFDLRRPPGWAVESQCVHGLWRPELPEGADRDGGLLTPISCLDALAASEAR